MCWDIPLSEDGSSFAPGADASRSPCGANMKLVSPPFILPAEAGESSAVGNHEGTWWVWYGDPVYDQCKSAAIP